MVKSLYKPTWRDSIISPKCIIRRGNNIIIDFVWDSKPCTNITRMHKLHHHSFNRGAFVDGFRSQLSAQLVELGNYINSLFAVLCANSAQSYPINNDNRFYLVNPLHILS